ncbi:MAG TPA: hypothetical protein VD731_05670 [Nitrosopumilaceae archaeon]|nr:hypothetical protein [Nitrosopumilaceae archaeon]
MRAHLIILSTILISIVFFTAEAHTTVHVEQYEIDVGWDVEPPVVGFRNAIVYQISESPSEGVKSGVISAFKNLESTIRMGGVTKVLDINSDPRPGHYFSKIIPTKTGSLVIELKGDIDGVPVNIEVPIEDVESTAVLDFPQSSGSSSGQEVAALKNAMSSIQKDVNDIKSKVGGIDSTGDINTLTAYNFGIFGLSLGAAGVILAIIAMIKRK